MEAASRGVDVRLITNSKLSSKTLMLRGLLGWMYWESSNHFYRLLDAGVRIFEWQKPGAFHSKNMVMDGYFSSIGSYNIARGSTFHHTESNFFVTGEETAEEMKRQFTTDFTDCIELDAQTVRQPKPQYDPYLRPLHTRNALIPLHLAPDSLIEDLKKLAIQEDNPC